MSEDLISKEKAYEVLTDYYHHKTDMQHKALREALDMVPSVDIDLSDYSDRLWRNAYEQGKADAEVERKKGKWIRKSPSAWMWTCSCCKKDDAYAYSAGDAFEPDVLQDLFCPNCGADMRGGCG